MTPPIAAEQVGFVVGKFISRNRSIHTLHFLRKTQGKMANVFLKEAEQSMAILEGIFKTTFPLGKLDHVALPDDLHEPQVIGANIRGTGMLGLITYRESDVLYERMQVPFEVIKDKTLLLAWNIAQQWLGNLVRVPNIRNVWCRESIALYLAYRVLENVKFHLNFLSELFEPYFS